MIRYVVIGSYESAAILGANWFQIPPLIGWFDTFIDSLIHWFMFRYMAIGTYVGAATVELIDSLIE